MALVAKPTPSGWRGADSMPFSTGGTAAQAKALRGAGMDFIVLYLGVAGKAQVDACAAAGLAVFGVTVANSYDGEAAVERAEAMGLPPGTSLFLDLEGMAAYRTPPADLIAQINGWADLVKAGGYLPGLYVASPQPLTTDELWHLHVERYWRAPARIVDRNGQLAEPNCGWCVYQGNPSRMWAGVWVDVDFVSEDFHGRTPAMAVPG